MQAFTQGSFVCLPVEANLKIRRPVKNTDWKTLTGRLSLKTLYFKTVQSRRAIKLGCIRACNEANTQSKKNCEV